MAKLKLKLFASLKDHFDEEIEIDISNLSLFELRKTLVSQAPKTESILSVCRFAVNDKFVNQNHVFCENDLVLILPPSSGG